MNEYFHLLSPPPPILFSADFFIICILSISKAVIISTVFYYDELMYNDGFEPICFISSISSSNDSKCLLFSSNEIMLHWKKSSVTHIFKFRHFMKLESWRLFKVIVISEPGASIYKRPFSKLLGSILWPFPV